ncbi:hypothetical protein [Corallococcus sicarius]|uniref:Uncharacterized protein n=1 Tax=Corallococcus sicarius TaxID=2316726 RepID=A0A3A8N6R5_9BACT|nr:hypothetical protein [Corallococcus sicarius]RKH40117.1 hypothetical protein D7X12_21695 [Corallococcus sicarius]
MLTVLLWTTVAVAQEVYSPEMLARLYSETPETFDSHFSKGPVTVYGELHSKIEDREGHPIWHLTLTMKAREKWRSQPYLACKLSRDDAEAKALNPGLGTRLAFSGVPRNVKAQQLGHLIQVTDCRLLDAKQAAAAHLKVGGPPPRQGVAVGIRYEDGSLATLWTDDSGALVNLGPGVAVRRQGEQQEWWLFDTVRAGSGPRAVVVMGSSERGPGAKCKAPLRLPGDTAPGEMKLTFVDDRLYSVERAPPGKGGTKALPRFATWWMGGSAPLAVDDLYEIGPDLSRLIDQRNAWLEASGEAGTHRKNGEREDWGIARINGQWKTRLPLPPVDPKGTWGGEVAVVDALLNPGDDAGKPYGPSREPRPFEKGLSVASIERLHNLVDLYRLKDGTLLAYHVTFAAQPHPPGQQLREPPFTLVSTEEVIDFSHGVTEHREALEQTLASNPCRPRGKGPKK